jgi:signal transduction histidine kinase/DNA-binding response OmpR family regulator/HPt (histidine-containing phosphotransfer) domain-containing protein
MNFARKFSILGFVVLVALGSITSIMVYSLYRGIAFAQKERWGVHYLETFLPVGKVAMDLQVAASSQEREAATADLGRAMARMETVDTRFATEATRSRWIAFRDRWTRAPFRGAAAGEAEAALSGDMLRLIAQVGEDSNLILDTELDSYYLMDCLVVELPAQVDALNQIRGYAGRTGIPSATDRTRIAACYGILIANLGAVRDDLRPEAGYRNPLFRNLQGVVDDDLMSVQEVNRILPDYFLEPKQAAFPSGRLQAASARSLAASFRFLEAGWPMLDDLLAHRIQVKVLWMSLALAIALGAVAACLYLLVGIHVSFRESLSGVVRALDQNDPSALGKLGLTDEFVEISQAAHKALSRLEEASLEAHSSSRAKSAFLANMSHEIRTPMNAILGMIQLTMTTDPDPRQRGYLEKTKAAAESLLGILNDILDFSKIEAGKIELEARTFQIEALLDSVVAIVGPRAQEKHLEFLLATAPEINQSLIGDPLRLRQVLVNLCDNALKFTHSGEVAVSTTMDRVAEDGTLFLRFTVKDTGIGMSAEQLERIFNPFTQADSSTTRRFGGTGLGLAISTQLVSLMGGALVAESAPGEGSTFSFCLPFKPGAEGSPARWSAAPALWRKRVLVVDDSPNVLAVLQTMLQALGFPALLVGTAEEGLEEFSRARATDPFDLVILDWKLPGMDGFEAARRILADHPDGTRPRIIMLSADEAETCLRTCAELGLDGFLAKPVTASSLFDAIMTAFGAQIISKDAPEPQAAPVNPCLSGSEVLLVEDNLFNQQVAKELLEKVGGIHVTLAANGLEAVQLVRARPFDLVLMDIQMPVMDGLEATRIIRREHPDARLPILAMTAHALVQHRQLCLEAGMDDVVTKPFSIHDLLGVLGHWISARDAGAPPSSQETLASAGPRLAGISWELGLTQFGRKEGLYLTALARFAEMCSGSVGDIQGALQDQDLDQATRLAHSLKSAARSIGALELGEAAETLEASLIQVGARGAEPRIRACEERLDTVLQGIGSLGSQAAE